MVKVKICGITNPADAADAVAAGCQALGFVFYRKSPRYIAPGEAARIIRGVPAGIKKVGVFVNASPGTIRKIARQCGLDMVQLHGEESPAACAALRPLKVIKAFRVKGRIDFTVLRRYEPHAFLLDTYVRSRRGGTGRAFDWKVAAGAGESDRCIFLSGGLNTASVRTAIRLVRPQWVDVSSSVERAPGRKDRRKMQRFVAAVRAAGAQHPVRQKKGHAR